jgi:phosphatidate cytidylyltransferase
MGLFAASLIGLREFYPPFEAQYNNGGFLVISLLVSIWICDSAAYYGGTALGKHKLFPRVSPKKSWEGAIFGFVFAVLTMIAAKFIVLDFLGWNTIISLGVIIGIIGQLGDLVESLLKRDAQVKDSSNFIPGHGGIFDRFDSLLLAAPVIFLFLTYVK